MKRPEIGCYNSPLLKLDFVLEITPYYLPDKPENLGDTTTTLIQTKKLTHTYNILPKLYSNPTLARLPY